MKWTKNDGQWDRVTRLDEFESIETEVYPIGDDGWATITWFVGASGNCQSVTSATAPDVFHRATRAANDAHDAAVRRMRDWRASQPEPSDLDKILAQLPPKEHA